MRYSWMIDMWWLNIIAYMNSIIKEVLAYLGRVTLTCPLEMISTDFPQNLYFHLWSESRQERKQCNVSLCVLIQVEQHLTVVTHTLLLPCQKVKFSDSAWHAEMGGWWLTWKRCIKQCYNVFWSHVFRFGLDSCFLLSLLLKLSWLPARWSNGSLCLLCRSRMFLPERGWRVCSDTSRTPRHIQRWRTLLHKPGNTFTQLFKTETMIGFVMLLMLGQISRWSKLTILSNGSSIVLAMSSSSEYSSSSLSLCSRDNGSLRAIGMDTLDRSFPMLLYRMVMMPMWPLSDPEAGRTVRRPGSQHCKSVWEQ